MGRLKTGILNEKSISLGMNPGDVEIKVLETGDIRGIFCEGIMINQLIGNCIEGMASNIYLRIKENGGYNVFPLIGSISGGKFALTDKQAVYLGEAGSIQYKVYLTPMSKHWFFDIILENSGCQKVVDLIYAQDIGLGVKPHVLSNEAYNSQYIDHKAFQTQFGYTVCSRQNQAQPTGFPFLQQGGLEEVRSFSVDGYPFFGLSYKFDNQISELKAEQLNNRIYQYEFAFTALQSGEITLENGESTQRTFYGLFRGNIETAVKKTEDISEIEENHKAVEFKVPEKWCVFERELNVNNTFCSHTVSDDELNEMYPLDKRRHVEKSESDGSILSFYKDTSEHVVLMEKEMYVERSHGHIILTGGSDYVNCDLLASSCYIYGVFNAQVVVGNTSFNKLISNTRNGLNISKISGQRIMIKLDGEYKLLTMPAVFEMGFNYAKWIYKTDDDIIEIISYTRMNCPVLNFEMKSKNDRKYDIIIYSQMCGAPSEYDAAVSIERSGNVLTAMHDESSMTKNAYKDLTFTMRVDRDFALADDSVFYKNHEPLGEPVIAIDIKNTDGFCIVTEASTGGKPVNSTSSSLDEEAALYRNWLKGGINNFNLSISSDKQICSEVERLNDLSLWYSHNARIHYASPHGIEQYGGAAWGTRDICQGPFEYFMAAFNYGAARDILEKVYSHQYEKKSSWPQWFMFDNYQKIQNYESHGDIIVWPLKALSYYILATGDMDFLNKKVPYTADEGFEFTEYTETVYEHVKKEISAIKNDFIGETCLSKYGDGDWDDTLQPADNELRGKMASGWTVALTYQAFKEFSDAISGYDAAYSSEIGELAEKIKSDFHRYIIQDGITAGFLIFDGSEKRYLLHPLDNETGINYRLLPMTRSMIAEIFTKEEAEAHKGLIDKYLYHPDGVRLMNTTCRYLGGVNTYFKRAETAANFGREIGLQYVHAHIRYIEAMAKIGCFEETWSGLMKITPILLDEIVEKAEKRQSNCYFSSSDGKFDNRYEAMKDFDKLRSGDIAVKGGWRLYSSGPGIYMNQLISVCLGIRISGGDKAVLDPVLPVRLNGLVFNYCLFDVPVTIKYNITKGSGVTKVLINGKPIEFTGEDNQYRSGGAVIDKSYVEHGCKIELFL